LLIYRMIRLCYTVNKVKDQAGGEKMEFYTAQPGGRPVRLSDAIRAWAWESMHGKYGDEALKTFAVSMDDISEYEKQSQIEQEKQAIRRIAECAPIRICKQERVSGSATMGAAIRHRIPVVFHGETLLRSVSHHTPNYRRAMTEGMRSYEKEIADKLKDSSLTAGQKDFLAGLLSVIDSMKIWHGRYLEETKREKTECYELLKRVPFEPAETFHEAVQSLWFLFAFMRLCGNWPGIGRIDWLLGDYLKKDLASGVMTVDEAREILASFFIKGCEWIESDTNVGSGDAQHYQNIVLGGIDETGKDVTNEVTYLVLDIVEELAISDFPVTVRINKQTPDQLIRRIGEVVRHGGGIVAVYNEETVFQAMLKAGYDQKNIWKFANDGCWEVQMPGETRFGYMPFDSLQLLNDALGIKDDGDIPEYRNIEEIYEAFLKRLKAHLEYEYEQTVTKGYLKTDNGYESTDQGPSAVVSLFTDGCIERAKNYFNLGPNYTVRSPHIGGAPDVANSLYAIDNVVFKEQRMTIGELIAALRDNWEGREQDRRYVHGKYVYYGNDNDEADGWMARILKDFAELTCACQDETPVKFVPGVSTFGRQINWLPQRMATAFGAKKGEILSGNSSPTPGTDASGATAIIRSFCKADMTLQTTGAALDIKLYPSSVEGEKGAEAIGALIRGFFALGGYFMQIDVMDAQTLREAQEKPEAHKTLSVRVSGWNARFVTLDKEWQDMVIERTAQNI